ncbi:2-dehydropantoate 2-reductase N-terminal domain-containing protein [Streptomyces sp. NPDC051219]|uniref:2-dehydropantoate 2-reductase N-terminal domain-containing protein n=1 Tax=Streptomyces sp. NPDC051219 TaxID=3155283 RepID=UPI003432E6B7
MKILVTGAGATGGFFGARLARAGRDVTFLVRPHRAAVLRRRGLRITGLGAEEVIVPQLVTATELAGPYDVVLLSVKATALEQAMEDVAPAIGPRTAIVPVLNGLAHLDELNARFGGRAVMGGVAKVVTTLNGERRRRHRPAGPAGKPGHRRTGRPAVTAGGRDPRAPAGRGHRRERVGGHRRGDVAQVGLHHHRRRADLPDARHGR